MPSLVIVSENPRCLGPVCRFQGLQAGISNSASPLSALIFTNPPKKMGRSCSVQQLLFQEVIALVPLPGKLSEFQLKPFHSSQAKRRSFFLILDQKTSTFSSGLKRSARYQSGQSMPPFFWEIFGLQQTSNTLTYTFPYFLLINAICVLR